MYISNYSGNFYAVWKHLKKDSSNSFMLWNINWKGSIEVNLICHKNLSQIKATVNLKRKGYKNRWLFENLFTFYGFDWLVICTGRDTHRNAVVLIQALKPGAISVPFHFPFLIKPLCSDLRWVTGYLSPSIISYF